MSIAGKAASYRQAARARWSGKSNRPGTRPSRPGKGLEIMQAADFLAALAAFIEALSRKASDVDRWRLDVTEAAHVLNSATRNSANGAPIEWVEFPGFLDFFDRYLRVVYLDWGGRGTIAPYPTPVSILRKLRGFAEGFGGRNPKRAVVGMTPEETTILEALADNLPTTMTREDLTTPTRLTEKTIGKYLTNLRNKKLVEQPAGPKKGYSITQAGALAIGR
jgi:hypothetical protein